MSIPIVFVYLVVAWTIFGHERIRPDRPEQLADSSRQKSVFVPGSRLSYVNYYALKRDFPPIQTLSNREIDQWIIENFSFISDRQTKLNGIRNSPIPIDPSVTKENYRPEEYGRAAILRAELNDQSIGLVDVKGFGHRDENGQNQIDHYWQMESNPEQLNKLRTRAHTDGLMRHGEAIAELTRQTAIQKLLDLEKDRYALTLETVESYFILELPFDVLGPDGTRDRAALYGRQAHWRGANNEHSAKALFSDDHGKYQSTLFGGVVDFGGVIVTDERLAKNFGFPPGAEDTLDPQMSLPWMMGHEVAKKFASGDETAVYRHLENMLSPILEEWSQITPSRADHSVNMKQYVDFFSLVGKDTLGKIEAQTIKRFFHDMEFIEHYDPTGYSLNRHEFFQRRTLWYALQESLNIEQLASLALSDSGAFSLLNLEKQRSWDNFNRFINHPKYAVRKHAFKLLPDDQWNQGVEKAKTFGIYPSSLKTSLVRLSRCLGTFFRFGRPRQE